MFLSDRTIYGTIIFKKKKIVVLLNKQFLFDKLKKNNSFYTERTILLNKRFY